MRVLSCLLLSLCVICSATAQTYIVNLKKEQLTNGRFVSEIIDVRINKNSIGVVPRSDNPTKPVSFKLPIKQELLTFFNKNAVQSEKDFPLIVKVYEIWISERTFRGKDIAKAEVAIEFIIKKENNYYKIVDTRGIAESYMVEAQVHHERNLVKAFSKCFGDLAAINIDEKIQNSNPLRSDLLRINTIRMENDSLITTLALPILTQNLKKGLYTDVEAFKNNAPTLDSDFYVEKKEIKVKGLEGYYTAVLHYSETKKRIKERPWGFYDGESIYVRFQSDYYPLTREGNVFTFYAPTQVDRVDEHRYMVIASGYGLIGSAIMGLAVGLSQPRPVKQLYKLNVLSGEISASHENSGIDR